MSQAKPMVIDRKLFDAAWHQVRKNKGAAGIDGESIDAFAQNAEKNLYKLWNRMSSGTYFPPPVREVVIPKAFGSGQRHLGIPTVADRVAQTVVKLALEPMLEPIFLDDSYAYRPNKSPLDAVSVTRERCWRFDWVIEFDIVGLFDNLSHDLMERAVFHHTDTKWIHHGVKRWMRAAVVKLDGSTVVPDKGVPQGGVISPLLANIALHYIFDAWITKHYPDLPWCRYADDGAPRSCVKEASMVA
jgi:RNA-directed DNA polymerase